MSAPHLLIAANEPIAVEGWTFFQGWDSPSGDTRQSNHTCVFALTAECESMNSCMSFNTNGFIKCSVQPFDQWRQWTQDPKHGLYVRNEALPALIAGVAQEQNRE